MLALVAEKAKSPEASPGRSCIQTSSPEQGRVRRQEDESLWDTR